LPLVGYLAFVTFTLLPVWLRYVTFGPTHTHTRLVVTFVVVGFGYLGYAPHVTLPHTVGWLDYVYRLRYPLLILVDFIPFVPFAVAPRCTLGYVDLDTRCSYLWIVSCVGLVADLTLLRCCLVHTHTPSLASFPRLHVPHTHTRTCPLCTPLDYTQDCPVWLVGYVYLRYTLVYSIGYVLHTHTHTPAWTPWLHTFGSGCPTPLCLHGCPFTFTHTYIPLGWLLLALVIHTLVICRTTLGLQFCPLDWVPFTLGVDPFVAPHTHTLPWTPLGWVPTRLIAVGCTLICCHIALCPCRLRSCPHWVAGSGLRVTHRLPRSVTAPLLPLIPGCAPLPRTPTRGYLCSYGLHTPRCRTARAGRCPTRPVYFTDYVALRLDYVCPLRCPVAGWVALHTHTHTHTTPFATHTLCPLVPLGWILHTVPGSWVIQVPTPALG